jgi:hypothetical protein
MASASSKRLREESFYELALSELEDGEVRKGIWAKSLVSSEGDEEKARAIYIKLRVESLFDEMVVLEAELEKIANADRTQEAQVVESYKSERASHVDSDERNPAVPLFAFLLFAVPIFLLFLLFSDK